MSYPRYEGYKDSGVEWISEVPEHWSVLPCRAFVKEQDQRNVGLVSENYLSLMANVGVIPYDEKGDVGNKKPEDLSKCKLVSKGDLVINSMNYRIGSYGLSNLDGVCSPVYIVLRPRSEIIETSYAFRIFQNRTFQTYAQSFGNGILEHRAAINWDILKAINVPIPPRNEQLLILTFLNSETAKIDALVDEQKRLIELLKEKRLAVISHAVTKGLNPNVPMKNSGVDWIGEVPERWEVTRLKFLAYVQGGVAKGRDLSERDTIEVPYLRVANVQDGYLDLEEISLIKIAKHELPRYALRPGDVLMNEGGDFDKLGRGHIWRGEIAPCIHQNHVFAVRPTHIEPEWLNLLTSAAYGRFYFMSRSKQSTNLASISSSNIREFPTLCPPSAERRCIIEYVDTEVAKLDALTFQAESAITLLEERCSALISAAVSGKIDVRGVVPSEAEAA